VNGESSIVRLDNGIRNFWRRNDGECRHHSIGILFTDFAEQKSTHTSTSTSTKRVCNLETLETIASFGFASNNIQNLIN